MYFISLKAYLIIPTYSGGAAGIFDYSYGGGGGGSYNSGQNQTNMEGFNNTGNGWVIITPISMHKEKGRGYLKVFFYASQFPPELKRIFL